MGGKGGGTNTVTNNSSPPPEVMAQYQHILGLANTQAGQPLQQYGGQMVAGFTPDQLAAFQGINNAQGIAAPYMQQAQGMLNNSQSNLWNGVEQWSPDTLNKYMSPYTNDVVNSTMANMNENNAQQQTALQGNAISKGAWGGDRAGIASAELSRQQSLADNQTIAGLRNQGYNTGMQAFQQQQGAQLGANTTNNWLASQGAFGEANLGQQAFQNALQGSSAQLASGTAQQQQNQSQLNIPYEQFLQRQAFPYQNLSWLSGISTGLGSGMGGTSTSSQPAPNQSSQMLGTLGSLGMLGYLAFSDRRLKEHIERIGKYKDYPLYSFNYKGTKRKDIGVMAQDVEKTNPGAVHESGGYKMVDYSKLARGGAAHGIAPGYAYGGFSTIPDAPRLQPEHDSGGGMDMATLIQLAKFAAMRRGGRTYAPGGAVPDVSISYIPGAASTGAMAHSTIPNAPQASAAKPASGGFDASNAIGMMSMLAKKNSPESLASQAGGAFDSANAQANGMGDMVKGFMKPDGGTNMANPVDINGDSVAFDSPDASMWGKLFSHFAKGGTIPGYAPGGASPYDDDLAYLYADPADQPTGPGIPPANPNMFANPNNPQPAGMGPPPAPQIAPAGGSNGFAPMPDINGIANAEPTYNKVDPALALLSGFAGMAAGKSPQFGNNFGEGVQAGVKNYIEQKGEAAKESQQRGSLQAQAERLYDEANRWREQLNESTEFHKGSLENQRRELDLKARQKWTIDPNTGMPMNVYTGEMKNPYAGVDTAAAWDEKGAPVSNVPDAYFPDMTPTQIMQYRNSVKKNQPKDLASQQALVSSLVDQKTKIDDLVKQIPVASSGDLHTLQDFADRNKIPVFSDPERGAATVSASYDTLGNVLDNVKTTFGGTGRVLQAEFSTLKNELNAAANLSPEQKAVVVAKIQGRLNDIVKTQVQYTNDVSSGMAYMPPNSASGKPIYQSPMMKTLTNMQDAPKKDIAPVVAPAIPEGVPPGSQYSPSRGMWRDSSGKMYDKNGRPV